MVSTQFKFSRAGGPTRRLVFTELPSWSELAPKIEFFYDIPLSKIGVAYVDSEGDEVTVSSEDELQDFYTNFHKPSGSDTIKFIVQDLRSLRSSLHSPSNVTSEQPPNVNYRNTFGGTETIPMVYEVEDDWQRLSGLPRGLGGIFGRDADGLFGDLESPTAFIEVLDSDVSSINKDTEVPADTTMESDLRSSVATPAKDKGKGKVHKEMQPSVEDDVSSAGSVFVEETNVKFPVHVLDVGTEGMIEPVLVDVDAHPGVDSPHSTVVPVQAESTPIDTKKPILPDELTKQTIVNQNDIASDPPLPSIDSEHPPRSASLANDVATLLNTFSSVLSAHPELSEGIRNITRNATNGTYWSAHREAVSRAAEEYRRSITEEGTKAAEDIRRAAEEEAGRRVADALGGFVRLFEDMSTTPGPRDSANPQPNVADASAQPTAVDFGDLNSTHSVPPPLAHESTPPPRRRPFSWGRHPHHADFMPPPPGPFPPPPHGPLHHGPSHHGRYGRFGPPPIIREPQAPFAPPLGPPHRAHWGSPFWGPPPPPPPPPPHSAGTSPFNSPFRRRGPNASSPQADEPSFADTTATWGPGPSTTPSPTELRAKVEIAKQNYKREKEMYRRAREERKAAEAKQAAKT